MRERQAALLTDEDVDKFIDKYASYENIDQATKNELSFTRSNKRRESRTKTRKTNIRKPVISKKMKKKKKKQTRFLTSADRLRMNKQRRKETDRRLRELLQKEEKEKQLACVSGVSECNRLSNALNTGIRYEVIEDDGVVVGVRAKLKPGISARKRAMRSTKQLMTPDEFVRERARLKRMAEREIRRRRYRRKSESNLLTLGNLLAATSAKTSTRRNSRVVKKTNTNLDSASVQNAIERALRDINEAKSKVETQTREFEKSGWVFGFDVAKQRGTRRRDLSARRGSF
eukprot:g2606.t1